ncbi:cytochrome c3 family protein [Campylobacter concisus]
MVVSNEPRVEYKLKPHYEYLSFDCIDCHQNQGDNPSKFKEIGDNGCTSCHTNMIGSNKISAQAQKMYTHYKKFLAVIKN